VHGPVLVVTVDRLTPVATRGEVVDGAWKLDTEGAEHAGIVVEWQKARPDPNVMTPNATAQDLAVNRCWVSWMRAPLDPGIDFSIGTTSACSRRASEQWPEHLSAWRKVQMTAACYTV
jgi:hypothetical protein